MGAMGGYPPYAGFTEFALALSVILSAIVSLIGTSGRKRTIALGEARMSDLAEMTGILDPKQVLAVFGPPGMDRTWPGVTLLDVRRARGPMGWLMSSDIVDYVCIVTAVIAMNVGHPLISLALLIVFGVQATGWIVSTRVPR
jgi:hypothetical protein